MSQNILKHCYYHPEYPITNFCSHYECNIPCCPKCVELHVIDHQHMNSNAMMEPIEAVHNKCFSQLEKIQDKFNQMIKHLNLFNTKEPQENLEQQLNAMKNKVYALVEEFFNQIESKVREKIQIYSQNVRNEELYIENNIKTIQQQVEKLNQKLQGDKALKYIILCHSDNIFDQLNKNIDELNQRSLQHQEQQENILLFNDQYFENFRLHIQNLSALQNLNGQYFQPDYTTMKNFQKYYIVNSLKNSSDFNYNTKQEDQISNKSNYLNLGYNSAYMKNVIQRPITNDFNLTRLHHRVNISEQNISTPQQSFQQQVRNHRIFKNENQQQKMDANLQLNQQSQNVSQTQVIKASQDDKIIQKLTNVQSNNIQNQKVLQSRQSQESHHLPQRQSLQKINQKIL